MSELERDDDDNEDEFYMKDWQSAPRNSMFYKRNARFAALAEAVRRNETRVVNWSQAEDAELDEEELRVEGASALHHKEILLLVDALATNTSLVDVDLRRARGKNSFDESFALLTARSLARRQLSQRTLTLCVA